MVLFEWLSDWRTDWSRDWLSGCSVAGCCCCEWPQKPQLNNFCCCNFCAFAFPLLLWQLKIFTLFAPVFKCCALQLLLLLLVPLFSSSPSLSVTIRYASVLSPQHKFCMVIYFFVGLWPGDASAKPSEGGSLGTVWHLDCKSPGSLLLLLTHIPDQCPCVPATRCY